MLPSLVLAALIGPPQTGLATIRYDVAPPNFAISVARKPTYLSALRGRVVVLDFWASWCHVCTAEMNDFVRAQALYGGRLSVVTISNEDPGVAENYFAVMHIDLPVVDDPTGAIERLYSIGPIPDTLVLDPAGVVTYVSVGGLSWNELRTAIDQAQARATASTPSERVLQ
jgi:thiol-disulfide isomerase/thioredoxin